MRQSLGAPLLHQADRLLGPKQVPDWGRSRAFRIRADRSRGEANRGLEGERQVVGEFDGFFHGSSLRCGGRFFAPDAGEGGLDLLLEAGDQFTVGGHQSLLGFDLRHDRLLRGEGWQGDLDCLENLDVDALLGG